MLSNAVLSARYLDWRDSMAFAPELSIPMDPMSIYRLNSAAAVGDQPVEQLRQSVVEEFADSERGRDWTQRLHLQEDRLHDIRLDDAERSVRIAGAERLSGGNRQTLLALEKTFAGNGYGVPAITILILLVVVVVAVVQRIE